MNKLAGNTILAQACEETKKGDNQNAFNGGNTRKRTDHRDKRIYTATANC